MSHCVKELYVAALKLELEKIVVRLLAWKADRRGRGK
jgi:hypothetical protein